ncbi:RNA-binding domain-containing protein [Mucilaginibacter sp. 3215]|uniref:ATP-binding protein n=1 Tax=Mucilaginibacter sp. 3215 TaxID=3373912 RepID=UPI003D1CA61C
MDNINGMRNTLKSCILESIKNSSIHHDFSSVLLTQDKTHAKNKNETEFWDYKEDIDLDSQEGLAKLATIVLAFHNSQGGCIIFGINNDYIVKGIYKAKIVDSVKLKNKLKRYVGNTVNIFQEQIAISINNKVIYLIFIPKRSGQPVPVHTNGPEVKGKLLIKKDDYYIRIGDETKICREPSDYERLFLDASFKHISAYQYEVDKPFYRLLSPHHRRLIGRDENITEVIAALNSRHFIISLDGVGGVGKSALAIETLRKIYGNGDSCKYMFIVSTSAKNKIWHDRIVTRQAGFSGLTELLEDIAEVFDLDITNKDSDELKKEIISQMEGIPGILFLDNIEEIQDNEVWKFLKDEVPEPVKVLVTSRIMRDIGARPIPVPAMSHTNARSLLYEELESYKYYKYIEENKEVDEILNATGYLPLAIKWAASMVNKFKNLKEVSSEIRKNNSTKKEFLHFCFSTMYDSLSVTGREVALCVPFLGENANTNNVSILLGKSIEEVDSGMNELENAGLIFFHNDIEKRSFFILPLTTDFLTEKLNQDGNFKKKLIASSSLRLLTNPDAIFLPKSQQIEVFFQSASILEGRNENLKYALQLVKSALQTVTKEKIEISPKLFTSLKFLDGKITYLTGSFGAGITRMNLAIDKDSESHLSSDDIIFFVKAIFDHASGNIGLTHRALNLFAKYSSKSPSSTKELVESYTTRVKRDGKKDSLDTFLRGVTSSKIAYWFVTYMWDEISNTQSVLIMGDQVIPILKLAIIFPEISENERNQFSSRITELIDLFSPLR